MANKNVMTIRVPAELKGKLVQLAEAQGVSINQLAVNMLENEIGKIEVGPNIANFWKGYSRDEIFAGFDEIMAKVKNGNVLEWDRPN